MRDAGVRQRVFRVARAGAKLLATLTALTLLGAALYVLLIGRNIPKEEEVPPSLEPTLDKDDA